MEERVKYLSDGSAVVKREAIGDLDPKTFDVGRIVKQLIFPPPKIRVAKNGAIITQNCHAQDHGGGYEGA